MLLQVVVSLALIACSAGLLLILYFVCIVKAPKRGAPPTLGWLPVAGSLLHMQDNLAEQLHQEFPGQSVVALYYGLEPVYILNNFAAFTEAMVSQGHKFVGRPVRVLQRTTFGGEGGLVSTEGELWREYRRFSLKTLRDFGFGRQGGEEIIAREASELCAAIDAAAESGQQSLDASSLISSAVSNVICQLVFGSRVAAEDPRFPRILGVFQSMMQRRSVRHTNTLLSAHSRYFQRFGCLVWLSTLRPSRRRAMQQSRQLLEFCNEYVEKHRREVGAVAEPRDYIDAHLKLQAAAGGSSGSSKMSSVFSDLRLALAIRDLFVAGTDTTSNSLQWGIVYMLEHPEVAEKVHEEIRANVGTDRMATSKDKGSLYYTMAVIEEVQRLGTLVPMGVARRSVEDSVICGYSIPADSLVIPNVYSIHRDPVAFPQPEQFKPERFLDAAGRFSPHDQVVPFGSGKRACLGESLARMELFIFFARLMQRYRFSLDPAERRSLAEIKDNAANHGASIRAPAAHRIVFTLR